MKASDFFKNEIRDNSYQGHPISQIALSQDFIVNTSGGETARKNDVQSFVVDLYHKIATKTLAELNVTQITFDDEFAANKDQKIFDITGMDFDDLKIYTGNIVGSIIYKKQIFNINCRFGNEFLQYMIANASGFLEFENLGAINSNLGLGEWILTYYWKLQLKKAFALGIYKTYQKKQENMATVKGNIDMNAFMKKRFFDGKTVCNFKEHSYNNELNSVIAMALSKVFKSKYQGIVADIYDIKNAFDSIHAKKVKLNQVRNHKVINPYFKKYNRVFDLSLKILNNEFANVREAASDFSAFLFDISLLFEHHIRKVLKKEFQLFPKNKVEFNIPNGIYKNNIYPDVIIDYGNNQIGVYDIKYKNFNFRDGVERDDRFQLTSYVATHMSKYKVVECGFIYPIHEKDYENKQNIREQTLNVGGQEIPFKIKLYKVCDSPMKQITEDNQFASEMKNNLSMKKVLSENLYNTLVLN